MKQKLLYCLLLTGLLLQVSQNIKAQQANPFNIDHTVSDGAQGNTIAFDGLAFLTGNFCACTFIPPGKVSDYFGFQYIRDNDITGMGHTTDFLTVIANNLLYVLDNTQKNKIIALAKSQVPMINQYANDRFPLIKAFVRLRDNDVPAGSLGLDKQAIMNYSAQLYRLDGRISIERARLYAEIIKSLTLSQKHYLDSVKVLGMANMPVLPDQFDKRGMTNSEFVATMSFAGDIFTWYAGSVEADVYFCPERQGDYFGGFYIKDAPAMGNHGYSIDTSLTQTGGQRFLNALNQTQKSLIKSLVDSQRTALTNLVIKRTEISTLLRGYLLNETIDTSLVLNLSEQYGQMDGEISYYYATNFSKVGWTLTSVQKDTLTKIRNLDSYPCFSAYLYSDSIGVPTIINTDFLFKILTGVSDVNVLGADHAFVYPNPFHSVTTIQFYLNKKSNLSVQVLDVSGKVMRSLLQSTALPGPYSVSWDGTGTNGMKLIPGIYFCRITAGGNSRVLKMVLVE